MAAEKKKHTLAIIAVILVALTFLGSSVCEQVSENEHLIITRFGKVNRVAEPGLNFKLPYPIESSISLEKRLKLDRSHRRRAPPPPGPGLAGTLDQLVDCPLTLPPVELAAGEGAACPSAASVPSGSATAATGIGTGRHVQQVDPFASASAAARSFRCFLPASCDSMCSSSTCTSQKRQKRFIAVKPVGSSEPAADPLSRATALCCCCCCCCCC